jgi:GAF domain-containing protein
MASKAATGARRRDLSPEPILVGRTTMDEHQIASLHRRIAGLARELHSSPGGENTVTDELVTQAVKTVPGAQYAGLTVVDRKRRVTTHASTHRYPVVLDDIQQTYLEGPCLVAAWEHHTVHVTDLETDTRWPVYQRAALGQTPIRSILCFQLFTTQHRLGALNVYADTPQAFDSESVDVGIVFATHAALAWDSARREDNFRSALSSRDLIGQAKGILMERFGIDAIGAFELLKQLSQESNTALADVARRVIEAGPTGSS